MNRLIVIPLFLVLALAALAPIASAAGSYSQGWDVPDDLAGWTPNTLHTTVVVVNAGGNPGGYLRTSRDPGGPNPIGATSELAQVSGNYALAGINEVSFDVMFEAGAFFGAVFRVRYLDPTFNGWYIPFTADFTPGVWKSYSIPFDPTWSDAQATAAGWFQESDSPTFAQTFANVYHPEIRLSGFDEPQVAGIDNFRLHAAVTAVAQSTWGNLRRLYR